MEHKHLILCTAVACSSISLSAAAEVLSVSGSGFEARLTTHIAAPPDKVFAALLVPAHWWSSEHTFSGSAANLVLDARAGGCFCENWPGGGSAEHMTVVLVSPGKTLRLRGALGPFQGLAVAGAMTWSLKGASEGTDLSLTYSIGGYLKNGFDDLSKAADQVLSEQVIRLKKSLEPAS